MAITYENFASYPIQILGLNESFNKKLQAIEIFVKTEIAYSGDVADLVPILPYFVFFKFCEDKQSSTTGDGEQKSVSDLTEPSQNAQVRAWNIGVKKLIDLCNLKSKTANCVYLSEINLDLGFIY